MKGRVIAIFIAPAKGAPMQEISEVRASKKSGLEGDRYGKGQGSWSTPGKTHRQITLIAEEAITAANQQLDRPFEPIETRRNILTRMVDLNQLVGKEFRIGEALLRGTKLCDPCDRPALLVGKKGFQDAFDNQGGLCAEVVEDGDIRKRDEIVDRETELYQARRELREDERTG